MLSFMASLVFAAISAAPVCPTLAADQTLPIHVPIEIVNNHVYVKVCAGSRQLQFILDTGAGQSFFDLGVATAAGVRLGSHFRGRGAGDGTIDGAAVENGTVALEGSGVSVPIRAALDLSRLPRREGHRMDGILGYDFISRYAVAIDYVGEELRLYDRDTFRYDGSGTSIPLTFADNHPMIDTDIRLANGDAVRGTFIVDVGSSLPLALTKPFVEKNRLRERVGTVVRRPSGGGVGGPATADIGRVAALRLGGVELHNVVTHLYGDSAGVFTGNPYWIGNIGGDALRRFTVILDYARSRIILEPRDRIDEPFETDMSGVAFIATSDGLDRIVVDYVLPGSPAAGAGLAAGDSLVAVEGAAVNEKTLIELRRRFRREGAVELTLKRSGETRIVKLQLRRLV